MDAMLDRAARLLDLCDEADKPGSTPQGYLHVEQVRACFRPERVEEKPKPSLLRRRATR
jgi:hypothetical protein